ncbi:MAG: hypothetical protein AB1567_01625 [bacterium]
MKGNKLIISGLVAVFVFCSQEVLAKSFELSGSGALSITQTNINNKTIEDIPPDLTIGLEYLVNGRFQNLDINSSIELKFNNRDDDWDEIVKSFTFGISNPRTTLNLGDLYHDISDFTLSEDVSMQFGIHLNQDIRFGEKTELMLIGGRLQEASVYESDDGDGVLEEWEDLNKNGKWDYGYSYYDQWLGGIRLSSSPTKNTFFGITYLKINDDKDSIEQKPGTETTPPIKNDIFGIDSAVSFYNHFLTVSGELSTARYENVGGVSDHDKAYKFSIKADKKKWNCELGYNHIGTNYYSAASPYLEVDKEGYFATYQWLPNDVFSFTLEGEVFEDNLLNDAEYPTTDTKIITTTFELKPQNYPQIILECELADELSGTFTDSYPKLDKFTTDILLEISHSIKDTNLVLSFQRTDTNDKSIDSVATEYEDYKSDIISLTLDTKFAKKYTLSNYVSYTKNKIDSADEDDTFNTTEDDTFNTTIDLTYEFKPQKLVFKPGYEFEEYRVNKSCSSREFTAKMDVNYYLSTTSQFTFTYERKENKNKEDRSTEYKADVGTIKYTKVF